MRADATRLPDAVIYELNATLETQGKRICRLCQGHPLPLDAEHFHRRGNGNYRKDCKVCYAALLRGRYAANPALRARDQARSSRYYYANHAQCLEQQYAYRLANRERINNVNRDYYQCNRERLLAVKHASYVANPDARRRANRRNYERRKLRPLARVLGKRS